MPQAGEGKAQDRSVVWNKVVLFHCRPLAPQVRRPITCKETTRRSLIVTSFKSRFPHLPRCFTLHTRSSSRWAHWTQPRLCGPPFTVSKTCRRLGADLESQRPPNQMLRQYRPLPQYSSTQHWSCDIEFMPGISVLRPLASKD